jgi:hypothetical protein
MKNTLELQIRELCLKAMKSRGIGELHRINLQLNELRKKLGSLN